MLHLNTRMIHYCIMITMMIRGWNGMGALGDRVYDNIRSRTGRPAVLERFQNRANEIVQRLQRHQPPTKRRIAVKTHALLSVDLPVSSLSRACLGK